ncbi:sulfatase-like hydrolase/transferase [Candidatus Poribacteria bacterium]|nr:sulfatase-like hydrolase/transferase [Candidatus Poribacteria bacterium]
MRRPNILILYTDQQRWDALGVNGNPDIQTPHLDTLARAGANFDRHFVQNPVCMPSRVSFLTGQYPSTLGITHMGVPVPEDIITLPRMLRNYGYTSANIGKLHFLPHANRDHRKIHPDYGFDHLEISDEPGCYEDAYRAWVRRVAPDQLENVSLGLPPATETWQRMMRIQDGIKHPEERFPKNALAFRGKSDVTHTAFVAEQTIEFIRQQRDKPFLCISGFYSPHSPWVAPQEFIDLYHPATLSLPEFPPEVDARRSDTLCSDEELRSARQGYYAMISEVDHHVGRILGCLDDLGLTEDTIVVFTSDHGEWLGEHLRYGKGYPGPDCVSRVPLLIRWPAGIDSSGQRISRIVEAVDVVPTLLECASIQLPSHIQGHSLLATISGKDDKTKDASLMEMRGWKALRTEGYRYVCEANGKESLYDLTTDPGEYHNVAADPAYASIVAEHRQRLLFRLIEIERPIPRVWTY